MSNLRALTPDPSPVERARGEKADVDVGAPSGATSGKKESARRQPGAGAEAATEAASNTRYDYERLRAALQEYFDTHPRHAVKNICKAIGVGAATLNQWKNQKYPGDVNRISGLVAKFLADRAAAEKRAAAQDLALPKIKPVETAAWREAFSAFYLAQDTRGIMIVAGRPGIGKTFAAKEYIRRERGGALFLDADFSWKSPTPFFYQAYHALTDSLTNYRLAKAKVAFLAALKDNPKTLVVNDAQNLSYFTIDHICAISESVGVAVILLGHERLIKMLRSRPNDQELWERIDSRVFYQLLTPAFTRNECRLLAEQYLTRLTDDGLDLLCERCAVMRDVERTCVIARRYQQETRAAANAALIATALKNRTAPNVAQYQMAAQTAETRARRVS